MSRSSEVNKSVYRGQDAIADYEADNSGSAFCIIDNAIHSNVGESKFAINDYLPDKIEVELKFEMDIDQCQEQQEVKNAVRRKLRRIKKMPLSLGRFRFREKSHRFCRRPFKYEEGQYVYAKWTCSNAHLRRKISLCVTLTMSGTRACRVLFFPEYFEKSGPYNQSNFIPILSSGDYQQYRDKVLSEFDAKIVGLIQFLVTHGFKCESRKLRYLELAYDIQTHKPDDLFEDLTSGIYALSRDAIRREDKDGYEQFFGKLDSYCEVTCYRKMKERIRLEIRVSDKMDTKSRLSQAFIENNFRLADATPAIADLYWEKRVRDLSHTPESYKEQSLEVNGKFIGVFRRMLSPSQVIELALMVDDCQQLKFNTEKSIQKSLRRRMRSLGLIRSVGWGIYKFMPYDEIERISLRVDSSKE